MSPEVATIASAFLGFLGGTIVNHWLANQRADRLRNDRIVDICQGIIGELSYLSTTIDQTIDYDLQHPDDQAYSRIAHEQLRKPDDTYYSLVKNDIGFLGWDVCLTLHGHYLFYRVTASKLAVEDLEGNDGYPEQLAVQAKHFIKGSYLIENQLYQYQRPYLRLADKIKWRLQDNRNKKFNRARANLVEPAPK